MIEFILRPGKAVANKMVGKLPAKIIFKLCFSENNYLLIVNSFSLVALLKVIVLRGSIVFYQSSAFRLSYLNLRRYNEETKFPVTPSFVLTTPAVASYLVNQKDRERGLRERLRGIRIDFHLGRLSAGISEYSSAKSINIRLDFYLTSCQLRVIIKASGFTGIT